MALHAHVDVGALGGVAGQRLVAPATEHDDLIAAQLAAHRRSKGRLVSGIKKDIVITRRLAEHRRRVAIYGWHRAPGDPIQPLYVGHADTYVDYSHGVRLVRRSATIGGESKVGHFELFIDGWRRAACKPGEPLQFDTATLADGYHELRVVAVETGLIASQGRKIFSVSTDNHGRKITASAAPAGTVRIATPVVVTADSPDSIAMVVLHNSRVVGQIKSASGKVEIKPAMLGYGPVRLRVVAIGRAGPEDYVTAKPIDLTVTR